MDSPEPKQKKPIFKLPVENGETLTAVQGFLQRLLASEIIEALLVPMRTPHGAVTPTLVSDPLLLGAADPLAPVMPVNAATLAGQLSVREPRAKVGVVLRSCELRALVELVKLKQADLENLILIAVDCAGTYEVPIYRQRAAAANGAGHDLWRDLYWSAAYEPENPDTDLRLACRMCEQPTYENADICLELLGSNPDQVMYLSMSGALAEALNLEETVAAANGRAAVLDSLVTARTATRDSEFSAIRERMADDGGVIAVLDSCIRCHNCMTVCPVCYCKTCVFKSALFDHDPMQYVGWARQKGACRMPADTTLFHLTRLNHMGLSCIGCGMCTQACPADLPVGSVFRAIGQGLQAAFDYVPGRSLEEPLPLITFREDEWMGLGEE
ncbi:MAG: formate dehydrogenase [Caldilineaceae bacterium]